MSQEGRLRLAFVLAHFRTGGAERVVLKLLQHLPRSQFDLSLILLRPEGDLVARVPGDVQVLDLGGRRSALSVLALARLLRRHRFDVAYTATNAASLLALAAIRVSGVATRCLVTEHTPIEDFIADSKLAGVRRWLMRRLYPRAGAIGAPVPEIAAAHRRLIPNCPKVVTLPNPVLDTLPPYRPPAAETALRFVSVGRLSPEKGFDRMIRAFGDIRAALPEARLTIHGEGDARDALESLVQDLTLEDCVALPGATDDVPGALGVADMFLCTSHREGFGNAIVEAQAASVPVASIDCPVGPRLLLQEGRAGCLTPDMSRFASDAIGFARDLEGRRRAAVTAHAATHKYRTDLAVAATAAAVGALV